MWIFYHNVTSTAPADAYSGGDYFNLIMGVAAMFVVGFLPMMIIHIEGKKDENR